MQYVKRQIAKPGKRSIRRPPQQSILSQTDNITRRDVARAKRIDPRFPIAPPIVRHQILVSRYDRTQILAERDVDGRTVVDRADADGEEVAGQLGYELGQPIRQ